MAAPVAVFFPHELSGSRRRGSFNFHTESLEDENLLSATFPAIMEGSAEFAQPAQRQVRLQLTTRDAEFALPENTGPILVPTGKLR